MALRVGRRAATSGAPREEFERNCANCYKEFPHLKALNDLIPDLEVVGVAADYDYRAVERVVAAQGLSWRQAHDDDASVRDLFRISFFPSSILVAPDGTIAAKNLRGERLVSGFENAMLAWEDRQVAAAAPPAVESIGGVAAESSLGKTFNMC